MFHFLRATLYASQEVTKISFFSSLLMVINYHLLLLNKSSFRLFHKNWDFLHSFWLSKVHFFGGLPVIMEWRWEALTPSVSRVTSCVRINFLSFITGSPQRIKTFLIQTQYKKYQFKWSTLYKALIRMLRYFIALYL